MRWSSAVSSTSHCTDTITSQDLTNSFQVMGNLLIQKIQKIALKVKGQGKCHQNLTTTSVYHGTRCTKNHQFPISSFSVFARTDTQNGRQRDRHTYRLKTLPASLSIVQQCNSMIQCDIYTASKQCSLPHQYFAAIIKHFAFIELHHQQLVSLHTTYSN